MKPVPANVLGELASLLSKGHSHRAIANKLHLSVGTVSNYRKILNLDIQKNKPGPRPLLSDSLQRKVVRSVLSGQEDNAVQVQRVLSTNDKVDVSAETVRRVLRKAGLKGRAKVKKPLLTDRHRRLRINFAKKYKTFSKEDWANVMFSDETKINRFGSDGREWVWKKKGESLNKRVIKETVKFGGGNIMLWGCMTSNGVGICHRIRDKMTAQSYISILEMCLRPSLEKWGKCATDVIFQHDNDPKHTAKATKEWLQGQEFKLLDWPPQSPDLNPIEHLWMHLKRQLANYSTQPRNTEELWSRVQSEWDKIPRNVCENLINSMPDRIKAVFNARGGHTKY